jgi:hypothetical protein
VQLKALVQSSGAKAPVRGHFSASPRKRTAAYYYRIIWPKSWAYVSVTTPSVCKQSDKAKINDLIYEFNLNSAVKEDENGADTRKHKGF